MTKVRMTREANKEDKRARIRDAAAALFVERGFEATTTAAVAERAGVAKGTVFLYAKTKEDLVALVFASELSAAIENALATLPTGGTIADEVEHVFGAFFAFYEPRQALARIFVKELMFPGEAAAKVRDSVDLSFLARLVERIQRAQARGELTQDVPPGMAANMWFGLYVVVLIAWLTGSLPSAAAARAMLRSAIDVSIRGLGSEPRVVPPARQSNEEGGSSCTPPPTKPVTSTPPRRRSARTAGSTSRKTGSATVATKKRGSR